MIEMISLSGETKEFKENDLVCYCFGHTRKDIEKDYLDHNGRSTILEKITFEKRKTPLYMGVSSFGISGTNSHVVLQEAPVKKTNEKYKTHYKNILTFSSKKKATLLKMAEKYRDFLLQCELNIHDICCTSNLSRTTFDKRCAMVGETKEDFIVSQL